MHNIQLFPNYLRGPRWLNHYTNAAHISIVPLARFLKFFLSGSLFKIFGCAGSSLLHGLSLVAVSGGYSLVAVCRLLVVGASLLVEHGL